MSLWKVMTRPMSQAAQVAGAQEAAQVNTTLRGREREHKLQLLCANYSVALSGPLPNIAQHPELNCEAAVYFQAGKFVWGAEGFKWIGDTKGGAAPGAGAGAGQGGQQPQYSVASQASQQQPARSPAT